MKLERFTPGDVRLRRLKALVEFFKKRLPATLAVTDRGNSYGYDYVVEVRGTGGFLRNPDKVCRICEDGVELESTQYLSDIEPLLKEYEKLCGQEQTLRYWETV